jgi:hypothetical protein
MSEPRPLPAAPEPGRRSTFIQIVSAAVLLGGLFFGGIVVGLAIAVTFGGGSTGAILVGFVALPLAFGLALGAWRALLGAWVIAALAKSALRSGGDEERFRDEMVGAIGGVRDRGSVVLPGTWVFVPITLVVGALAAVAMAVVAEGDGPVAGVLLFGASAGLGMLMRRLARTGRLLIPGE